jgi:hypothetical protein
MMDEGPPLQALTHRLTECPPEFLAEPRIGNNGMINVAAVVYDLIRDLSGGPLDENQLAPFKDNMAADRNWLRVVLISSWLLHDPWFIARRIFSEKALAFLADGLRDAADLIKAQKLISDPDRREELARLLLKALDLLPEGETPAQAQDRLTTISSIERRRVIAETQKAQERAREIREALRKRAAEEAAAKVSRE